MNDIRSRPDSGGPELVLSRPPAFSFAARYSLRQWLMGSLWVVPLLGGVAGLALAQLDPWIESTWPARGGWRYSADTASDILTAIVGAMVGLFGFVVTISVLVVQMATETLSPRFMRLWYRDRLQKLVLACFIGTVTFAFALHRSVRDDSVPSVGITLAGIAFGVSLILLLLYLDRFAHNLRPVGMAELVARRGLHEVDSLARARARTSVGISGGENPFSGNMPAMLVGRVDAGAIQAIDVHGLFAEAVRHDCAIVLKCSVGDFIRSGTPIVNVHAARQLPRAATLAGCVVLGRERSIEDDPAFALRIMVDVATRALSPAVNDPTTAVQLINYIDVVLCGLAPYTETRNHVVITDAGGTPRVVVPTRTFEDYLRLALTEIRQYGATSVPVTRRLTAMLESMLDAVPPARRPAVEAELVRLRETVAAHVPDPDAQAFALRADRQGLGGPDVD
jgi:uncharacterized membrane protein